MKEVKAKEVIVSNLNELLSVIIQTLIQCRDTKFLISNLLLNRLLQQSKNSILWEEHVLDSFYYPDGIEKAFLFYVDDNKPKTFQMHFVKNYLGYMHLTFFASKGIIYRDCLKPKKILIINSD